MHNPGLTPDNTSSLAFRFGKFVCLLCVCGGAVRASLGQAPDPVNVATQGRDTGKAGQSRQAQCRRQGTGSGQSGPGIPGAQSTLSGLWRGIRPQGSQKGQIEKETLKLGHSDTHASARIHIDAPLEHRLGLVAKDSGALAHCYDDSGCAGLARGGGETGQPPPRDADSAGHLLEPHSVPQACDSESGGRGLERGQDVRLGTGERGLGYFSVGAREQKCL